ncbi:GGDEF domain-containing protein [Pseudoalteromonas mariniglutinosa]|uniref:GGDEF domain-containing protein n=1 Tax=Pseudoalteromonas mariniglutinosa TaxID=206042 RepID=UPI003850A360
MDISALRGTQALRSNVLKWMSFFLGILAVGLALFNIFINGSVVLGTLEAVFAVFCFYTFYYTRSKYGRFWQSLVLCLSLIFIVALGTHLAAINNGLFIWSCVLPIICYLLLGKKVGMLLSFLLALLQAAILISKSNFGPFNSVNFAVNISLTYLCVWAISHSFENSRAIFAKRLENLALLDPLTGAGNRLAMNHYFEVEQLHKENLYVLLLDLDYFKAINDQYGHAVGDRVLIEVVTLLRKNTPHGYVFRIGGEEFAIFSLHQDRQAAYQFAEQLRACLATSSIVIDGITITITVSIGVAHYQAEQTLKSLVKNADDALYKAKQQGRNKVITAYKVLYEQLEKVS